MATSYFKLEQKDKGETSAATAEAIGALVLRVDSHKGKTTIYFAADKRDPATKALRARASEIKLPEITRL
jgi:hypothetical protein